MKKISILLIILSILSCKNNEEEHKILYNKLIEYRDELKMNYEAKDSYLLYFEKKNEYFKKRNDSLNTIVTNFKKNFENIRYGTGRDTILKLRDNFNKEHNLYVNFKKSKYTKNLPDSIFNRVIEVDFYKLMNQFQDRYMFRRGCL
ncbi:hypothetical protein [Flavobacterium columnare]|uniref:Lipoprotein n=1 Tax=Flavobacterium columnare TaxID=996 RepID=A0AAI8CHF5_9FLAO|nr:hypothetical protein [Flavobacterium columnare]AMO19857.1 hypothetical protein UN65_05380 [Flavobacterium columnare]AUX17795.1 hypothetical protein AQ623_05495 [Flavobacterium columnare]QOG56854.1 hypothetical protein HUE29_05430 [Flavobacterium columnare]QOG59579.1 hypothetical protein HUE30_05435 [Flavobacterium columnare]QOG62299.1 hypothetical protein HUE31_05435 [Flavobacterium columnare]